MNLKTKQHVKPMQFAYLIVPDVPVENDEQLYAAVRKEGRAVLRPFEGHSFKLKIPIALSPDEFERDWKGD